MNFIEKTYFKKKTHQYPIPLQFWCNSMGNQGARIGGCPKWVKSRWIFGEQEPVVSPFAHLTKAAESWLVLASASTMLGAESNSVKS